MFFTGENYQKSGVSDMNDTWWGQVISCCGGELLVNNSWSGSRVTKLPNRDSLFPSGCSDERTNGLHIGSLKPDVIIVYLGTNDWVRGVEVSVSPTFCGWVFSFAGKIKITSPQQVVNEYKSALGKALDES